MHTASIAQRACFESRSHKTCSRAAERNTGISGPEHERTQSHTPERLRVSLFTEVMTVELGEPRETAGDQGNVSVVFNELLSPRKQPLKDMTAYRHSILQL